MKSYISLFLTSVLIGCGGNKSKNNPAEATTDDSAKVTREEVKLALREQTPAFRSCLENYVEETGQVDKSGKFNFQWTIMSTGTLANVTCNENSFDDQIFEKCMKDVISSTKYPAKTSSTRINYPFKFQGKD